MLTLWRPHNDLFRMSRDFDSFFNRGWTNGEGRSLSPEVDIEESENQFLITADLPGVEEANIDITVKDGVLTISGHREESKEEQNEGTILRERSYGSFQRSMPVPDRVDADKINAKFEKGVLVVTMPKKAEAVSSPRKISIGK